MRLFVKISRPALVIALLIIAYTLFVGAVASLKHYRFQTQTWDMGVFEQLMWNTVDGRVMKSSIEEVTHHFGVHLSPFLFALIPGFAVFSNPYYLIIAQTLALAIGVWPLWLLARRLLGGYIGPFSIALSYLLFPSLIAINLYDFHPVAFFIPLSIAALYSMEMRRHLWTALFLGLAASTQEDAAIIVVFFSLFWFLRSCFRASATSADEATKASAGETKWWRAERWRALAFLIASLVYVLLTVKVIMPSFGGGLLRLDRYASLGVGAGDILKTLITKPAVVWETVATISKLNYFVWLFFPLLFLPFFSPRSYLFLVPGLLENLLTTYQSQFSGLFQYDSVIIGPLFVASVYGFKKIISRFPLALRVISPALIILSISVFAWRSPLGVTGFPKDLFHDNLKAKVYRSLVELVPAKASVAAHTNLVPHLSNREQVAMLGYERASADIVIIDGEDSFGFADSEAFQKYYEKYRMNEQYKVSIIDDRFIVIVRNGVVLNKPIAP